MLNDDEDGGEKNHRVYNKAHAYRYRRIFRHMATSAILNYGVIPMLWLFMGTIFTLHRLIYCMLMNVALINYPGWLDNAKVPDKRVPMTFDGQPNHEA